MTGRLLFVIFMSPFLEIQAQAHFPPKLTVNPLVINETDSVTLNCQTPSSVSVSECYFTLSGGSVRTSSCQQKLTGTELLKMDHQNSSAEVKVMCFYTVKIGEENSPSPHSEMSSITIRSQTPQMSLEHFYGDHVLFICSLPESANHDTRCNLYFGEASRPVLTTTMWKERTSRTNQWFCQFTVTIDDLLRRLSSVQQSVASCDYSLGSEPNSLSPRSDGFSLTGWPVGSPSNTDSSTSTFLTSVKPASGLSVSTPGSKDNSFTQTPLKTVSEKMIMMIGGVMTAGVLLLGLALLVTQNKIEKCVSKRPKANVIGKSKDRREYTSDNSSTSEKLTASALRVSAYSTKSI